MRVPGNSAPSAREIGDRVFTRGIGNIQARTRGIESKLRIRLEQSHEVDALSQAIIGTC